MTGSWLAHRWARWLACVFVLASAAMYLVASAQTAAPRFTSEPLLTTGHGAFIAADGKQFAPDREFVLRAQRYYIETLQRQARAGSTDGTRVLIFNSIAEEALANALYIGWLIDTVKPQRAAQLRSFNEALRAHYLYKLLRREVSKSVDARSGVARETLEKLQSAGIGTSTQGLSGRAYIDECRDAGVPIPPPIFSRAWSDHGELTGEFILPDERAELLHWQSTPAGGSQPVPAGVCLALPRYFPGTDDAAALGVICLGTESSNACFWDNPSNVTFTKGVEVDITEFVGGTDLSNGMCTDCHAGENPFVVHPDKPPFDQVLKTPGLTLMPNAWYRPIGLNPTWPQNPGPSNLLPNVSSPGRCDTCHERGRIGGRFPDPAGDALRGWCGTVLESAVGTNPAGFVPPTPGTMPPSYASPKDRNQYTAHIDAIRRACGMPVPDGKDVPVGTTLVDDVGFISPPTIGPLYACSTSVAVSGGIRDATVSLFINGVPAGSRMVRRATQAVEFTVPQLKVNDVVTAKQQHGPTLSASSPPVTVRDHRIDFPAGLPPPVIDPTLVYECASLVAVHHTVGSTVTLRTNGAFPSTWTSAPAEWIALYGGRTPFLRGDQFTATQELCADKSLPSAPVFAVAAPSTIPTPTLASGLFVGQEEVAVENLVNGSTVTVEEVGTGSLGTFSSVLSWGSFDVARPLGRPIALGDEIKLTQKLCNVVSPPGPIPTVMDCSKLPAPRVTQPRIGDTAVVLSTAVPGARIHIYDAAGIEIGDGPGVIIVLKRALVVGDVITVIQQLANAEGGRCSSTLGYRIRVL